MKNLDIVITLLQKMFINFDKKHVDNKAEITFIYPCKNHRRLKSLFTKLLIVKGVHIECDNDTINFNVKIIVNLI